MIARLAPLLALIATVPAAAQGPEPQPSAAARWSHFSIRERIVIRIPRMRRAPPPPEAALDGGAPSPGWVEKRGDRCVAAGDIAGALVSGGDRIDLVMVDGRRARALLEASCPALDYYLGFYIRPTRDGKVCAGRDAIRSRSGAACAIHAFRRLEPGR